MPVVVAMARGIVDAEEDNVTIKWFMFPLLFYARVHGFSSPTAIPPSIPFSPPFYRLNMQAAGNEIDVQEMVCCSAQNVGL